MEPLIYSDFLQISRFSKGNQLSKLTWVVPHDYVLIFGNVEEREKIDVETGGNPCSKPRFSDDLLYHIS